MTHLPDDAPVLFYDADCAMCTGSVAFILRRERPRRPGEALLRFAARRGPIGEALHQRRPELEAVDSLLWHEPGGRVLVRSDAVVAVARYVGGACGVLGSVLRIAPRPLRDAGYRVIAALRRRIVRGQPTSCPAGERWRFLDPA